MILCYNFWLQNSRKFLISCCQQTYSNMSFFQPKFLNTSQPSTIYQSAFDGSRKTVLIVHGFIDTGFVHWVRVSGRYLSKHFQIRVLSLYRILITNLMFLRIPLQELSSKLLSYHDLNVISVDWGGGSASMYSTSAANTRVVGLEVAHLINFLKVNWRCFDMLIYPD